MEMDPFFAAEGSSSSSSGRQRPPPAASASEAHSSAPSSPPGSHVDAIEMLKRRAAMEQQKQQAAAADQQQKGLTSAAAATSVPGPVGDASPAPPPPTVTADGSPPQPERTMNPGGKSETEGTAAAATATATGSKPPSSTGGGNNPPPSPGGAGPGPSEERLGEAYTALALLLQHQQIDQRHVSTLQSLIRENSLLKEKVVKLKSLLGRSAKAQKDAKLELASARAKLEESNQTIAALNAKVEQLANRPTHYLDLVADFESNFDRALLAIDSKAPDVQQQSGGEDSSSDPAPAAAAVAAPAVSFPDVEPDAVIPASPDAETASVHNAATKQQATMYRSDVDDTSNQLLVSELDEARAKIEKLENLQTALLHRASKLEKTNEEILDENQRAETRIEALTNDLKTTRAEAERATSEMKEKAASLAEMQLEIDLVTRASVDANARANNSIIAAQTVRTDRKHVGELEAKVNALTEWALASAEAKTLAVERNRELEEQVKCLRMERVEGVVDGTSADALVASADRIVMSNEGRALGDRDRRLWIDTSSLVVGAGMAGSHVVELGDQHDLADDEIVLLRWKFDLTPSDLDITFSILKGKCSDDTRRQNSAEALIKDRVVLGGAGGEIEGAFAVDNACTLVWCNKTSWVRPRTIKFTIEAIASR